MLSLWGGVVKCMMRPPEALVYHVLEQYRQSTVTVALYQVSHLHCLVRWQSDFWCKLEGALKH